MFDQVILSIDHIRAGRLKALAVSSADKLAVLPDLPPVSQFVPGYEAFAWQGMGAPKNTPPEILNRVAKEINAALADPKMQKRLADLGGVPMPKSPEEFGALIANETTKWAKVIKFANIKAG
jgi:tripartite-type tricarboxylate transporter receptor subunit TctC